MSHSAHTALSDDALELVAGRFRILGEPNRLRLIQTLRSGEQNVSDLVAATGLTQANVSRHLGTLTDAGILGRRKEGLNVIYFIADTSIFDLCEHVCGSIQRKLLAGTSAFAESTPVQPSAEDEVEESPAAVASPAPASSFSVSFD